MFEQLIIGTALIVGTVLVQVSCMAIGMMVLHRSLPWMARAKRRRRMSIVLAALTVWILLPLTITIWAWSFAYLILDALNSLEAALYFSAVAFTTLGFGDIVLDTDWRLLSTFTATNGLIVFALSTAFLIEVLRQIGRSMERNAR